MRWGDIVKLNIELDKKYYKSDFIENGRVVSKFFNIFSDNIFNQSYKYYESTKNINAVPELPILFDERNLYSLVAVALDKITPIHLTEWPFNTSDNDIEKLRRVDFWCLNKDGKTGKPINYFIELKKGWYCLNKNSKEGFDERINGRIKSLVEQTKSLKSIAPNWENVDDVFLGILIIHGYYKSGEEYFDSKNVRDNIYNDIDKRMNAQLLFSTWILPEDMNVQWEGDKCKFISIAGIVITKKKVQKV